MLNSTSTTASNSQNPVTTNNTVVQAISPSQILDELYSSHRDVCLSGLQHYENRANNTTFANKGWDFLNKVPEVKQSIETLRSKNCAMATFNEQLKRLHPLAVKHLPQTECNLASDFFWFLQMSNQLANTNNNLAKLIQDYGTMMEQKVQAEKMATDASNQKLLAEQASKEALSRELKAEQERKEALEERAKALEEKARALEEKARAEAAKKMAEEEKARAEAEKKKAEEQAKKMSESKEKWKQKFKTLSRAVSLVPSRKASVAASLNGSGSVSPRAQKGASGYAQDPVALLTPRFTQKVAVQEDKTATPQERDRVKMESYFAKQADSIKQLLGSHEETENDQKSANNQSKIDEQIFELLFKAIPESPSDVVSLPPSSSVNFFNAGKDAALQKVVDQLKVGYQLYESNQYLKCGAAQAKAYMEQFRKKYTHFKEAQGVKKASTQQHKPIIMTNYPRQ